MNKKNDIKELTIEQPLSQLEEIEQKIEKRDIDLEDSIDMYERGTLLKAHCEEKLKSAKLKVDKIIAQPDGDFTSEPYEDE